MKIQNFKKALLFGTSIWLFLIFLSFFWLRKTEFIIGFSIITIPFLILLILGFYIGVSKKDMFLKMMQKSLLREAFTISFIIYFSLLMSFILFSSKEDISFLLILGIIAFPVVFPLLAFSISFFTKIIQFLFAKTEKSPGALTKITAILMVISGFLLFILSIFIHFMLFATMSDDPTYYSLANISFILSPFLIIFGFFLLKRKKIFLRILMIFISLFVSFLCSSVSFFVFNIHKSVIFPFIFGLLFLLFLLILDRNYYCQALSKGNCEWEAKISFKSGIISIVLFGLFFFGAFFFPIFLQSGAFDFFDFSFSFSSLMGLIFGILGLSSTKKKLAKTGIFLSLPGIIFLFLSLLNLYSLYYL